MLTFKNLTIGYNRHPAVHHLNATIKEGDFIALIGPNGAGKSTLLKTILGHVLPLEGQIIFNDIAKTEISYLPQSSAVDRKFPISAEQFVATGLWHESGPFKPITRIHRKKIHQALHKVGMHGFEKRSIEALSGGQFQRVLFARKLIQNARLLLLDEPFAGVDERTIEDLMNVLAERHLNGATIVAVVHNLELVRRYFPKTMMLSRELIGFGETEQVITTENLARASSIALGDVKADICEVTDHA